MSEAIQAVTLYGKQRRAGNAGETRTVPGLCYTHNGWQENAQKVNGGTG